MNTLFTFILGMFSGWLLEWLIGYFSGRRRAAVRGTEPARPAEAPARAASLPPPEAQAERDDLKVIKGIGKVIEGKLNEAGIYTFKQLGSLTPGDLRRILGKTIQRLADEDSLLKQARGLARKR